MARSGSVLLTLLLLLSSAACKKAPPTAPAPDIERTPTTTAAPAATRVAPAPTTSPTADVKESELDGDLQTANAAAYRDGLLGEVLYDFDSFDLRSDARERLAKNADFFRQHPEFVVSVEGYCDERGTNEYNLALGERRAASARDYLVSLGIDGGRMRTLSYGEERPKCQDSNEGCWQQNRRVRFLLTGRR